MQILRILMQKGIYCNYLRLNDFWKCRLSKITNDEILKILTYKIYKQQFIELSITNKKDAITLMETKIFNLIDHHNKNEVLEYKNLCQLLLKDGSNTKEDKQRIFDQRYKLFEEIIMYLPENMIEPKQHISEHSLKV